MLSCAKIFTKAYWWSVRRTKYHVFMETEFYMDGNSATRYYAILFNSKRLYCFFLTSYKLIAESDEPNPWVGILYFRKQIYYLCTSFTYYKLVLVVSVSDIKWRWGRRCLTNCEAHTPYGCYTASHRNATYITWRCLWWYRMVTTNQPWANFVTITTTFIAITFVHWTI